MSAGVLHDTAVAFLAGGESSRMGRPKALLTLGRETFLERQARIFSGFPERILSANDSRVSLPGLRRVGDVRPGLGPLGGLYSVLRVCRSSRVFFVPCDTPFLTMEIAVRLLDGLGEKDACVAVIDGRIEPLGAVYARKALPVMERCLQAGEYRLRAVLSQLDCRKVPLHDIEDRRAFTNVNTPEELQKLLQEWEGRK